MADAKDIFLEALMGGGSSGANMQDLGMFQQDIAANNIYGDIGSGLMSKKFDTSTWTPKETGLTTALQMFAGTLLKDLGERRQVAQLEKVAQVLPDLYANPLSVQAPEGVDRLAFAKLKQNIATKAQMAKASQMSELAKDLWGVELKGQEAAATAAGSIRGKESAMKDLGISDPENLNIKGADTLRKELLSNKEIADFQEVKTKLDVLKKAKEDPSSVADLDYVYAVAKVLDPASVVRESEGQTILESQSIPASVLGQLNKSIRGESGIDRANLYKLAERHYGVRRQAAKGIADSYISLAKKRGISPEDILPFSLDSIDQPNMDVAETSAAKGMTEGRKPKIIGFRRID